MGSCGGENGDGVLAIQKSGVGIEGVDSGGHSWARFQGQYPTICRSR
jgi:hypothetical protein